MKTLHKEMKTLDKEMKKMSQKIKDEVSSSIRQNVIGGYLDAQREMIKSENKKLNNLSLSDLEKAQKEFNYFKKLNKNEKDKIFAPYKTFKEDKEDKVVVKSRYGFFSNLFSKNKEVKNENGIMDYNFPTKEKPYYHKVYEPSSESEVPDTNLFSGNDRHYNKDLNTLLTEAINKEINESFIEKHYREANGLTVEKNAIVDDSVFDEIFETEINPQTTSNSQLDLIKELRKEINELKFKDEFSDKNSRLIKLEKNVEMLLRGTGIKEYTI